MIRVRSSIVLLGPVLLISCDQPRNGAPPEPKVERPATFRNEAAKRSIMQPDVIAESEANEQAIPEKPVALPSATIAFPSGSALDETARSAIEGLLADPALPPGARFVLRGHSDSEGADADNLMTSRKRAEAVRALMVERGIARDRITVIALGERRPIAPNATRDGDDNLEGRMRNRRVEIEVLAAQPVSVTPDEASGDNASEAPPAR